MAFGVGHPYRVDEKINVIPDILIRLACRARLTLVRINLSRSVGLDVCGDCIPQRSICVKVARHLGRQATVQSRPAFPGKVDVIFGDVAIYRVAKQLPQSLYMVLSRYGDLVAEYARRHIRPKQERDKGSPSRTVVHEARADCRAMHGKSFKMAI